MADLIYFRIDDQAAPRRQERRERLRRRRRARGRGQALQGGCRPTIGGRVYQDTKNGYWASYSYAARANQVSNYQFKSPGEWFAEAYATFYDPSGGQAALRGRDRATYDWFMANVHNRGIGRLPDPE